MNVPDEYGQSVAGRGCDPLASDLALAGDAARPGSTRDVSPARQPEYLTDPPTSSPIMSLPVRMTVKAFVDQVKTFDLPSEYGRAWTLAWISVPFLLLGLMGSGVDHQFGWMSACVLGLAYAFTVIRQAELLSWEREARRLSLLATPWIGVLSKALEWPDRKIRAIAGLLLTQFLPLLKVSDNETLSREARNALYRQLSPRKARRNPDLTIAILGALPEIGTDSAVPYVVRLCSEARFVRNPRAVRNTARAILPALEARVAIQRADDAANRASGSDPFSDNLNEPTSRRDEVADSLNTVADAEQAQIAVRVDAQIREFEAGFKSGQPGMRIGFLLASWATIVPYMLYQSLKQFSHGQWPLGLAFAALTGLGTQLYRLTMTDKQKALAHRLGALDDVRCIGRLVELLEWPDRDVRAIAIAALNRLLPRVRATDGVGLTSGQRGIVHGMLVLAKAGACADLMVNLMKALEQIGDSSDVSCVERLANAQPGSPNERLACDAASECLPYLMARSKVTQTSQTLLRASSALSTGTDSLVRAAGVPAQTDPDQLLRPGELSI